MNFLDSTTMSHYMKVHSMQQRVMLVPDEGLYLAFRLPPILREAGYGVDALCVAGDSIRRSRYLENVTTLESIEEQIRYLHRHMRKAGTWDKLIIAKESVVRHLAHQPEHEWIRNWQPGLADPLVRDLFQDKGGIIQAAQAWGFPMPREPCLPNGG